VELRSTLSKSKLGSKIDASGSSVDQLVDLYSKLAAVVEPAPLPRIAPDPDDDVAIGTALAAKAEFLVTGDHALLSVAKYEYVRVVSVHEALDAVARAFPHEDH
jgi:hypothetical protein